MIYLKHFKLLHSSHQAVRHLFTSIHFPRTKAKWVGNQVTACASGLEFYRGNCRRGRKNAVETAKIAVDSCYVSTAIFNAITPWIDFREIRGLLCMRLYIKIKCFNINYIHTCITISQLILRLVMLLNAIHFPFHLYLLRLDHCHN